MSKELLKLADEIEELINQGITESMEDSPITIRCSLVDTLIRSSFGKNSKEHQSYRQCDTEGLPTLLRELAGFEKVKGSEPKCVSVEVNVHQSQIQHQTTEIAIEIVNQIISNIDSSELSDTEKEEAKKLVEQVREEVTKPDTNWGKVTNLLRRSFDYGLEIAPKVVKLAELYYQAKGLA